MTVITQKMLDEILDYMEKVINNLSREAFESLELVESQEMESFLENQFNIRFENILEAKNISINHLESGIKNKIIQRKQRIIEGISKQYKN